MSLTIGTTPDTINAAYNPVLFILTSNRDDNAAKANSALADNGSGYCRFTFATPHTLFVGDVVTGSSYSNSALNVDMTITAKTSTTIDVSLAYVAGYSGLTGTITRLNANFQVKAEITVGSTLVATVSKKGVTISSVESYRYDISRFIADQLSCDIEDIGSAASIVSDSTPNGIKDFEVTFTEQFDDIDGILTDGDDITSSTYYGVNAALQPNVDQDLDDYILGDSAKKFLSHMPTTQQIDVDEEIQFTFLSNAAEQRLAYQTYNLAGVADSVVYSGKVTINDKKGIAIINSTHFGATKSRIDVWIVHDTTTVAHSETIRLNIKNQPRDLNTRLVFLNSLGGFDWFTFTRKESVKQSIKRSFFMKDKGYSFTRADRGQTTTNVQSEIVTSLWSRIFNDAEGLWLQELYDSIEVFRLDTVYVSIIVINKTHGIKTTAQLKQAYVEYVESNKKVKQYN